MLPPPLVIISILTLSLWLVVSARCPPPSSSSFMQGNPMQQPAIYPLWAHEEAPVGSLCQSDNPLMVTLWCLSMTPLHRETSFSKPNGTRYNEGALKICMELDLLYCLFGAVVVGSNEGDVYCITANEWVPNKPVRALTTYCVFVLLIFSIVDCAVRVNDIFLICGRWMKLFGRYSGHQKACRPSKYHSAVAKIRDSRSRSVFR